MERGLKIPQSERTKTTNSILKSLINQLEKCEGLYTLAELTLVGLIFRKSGMAIFQFVTSNGFDPFSHQEGVQVPLIVTPVAIRSGTWYRKGNTGRYLQGIGYARVQSWIRATGINELIKEREKSIADLSLLRLPNEELIFLNTPNTNKGNPRIQENLSEEDWTNFDFKTVAFIMDKFLSNKIL
ncbi:hypothetical protein Cgig2_007497 [Carnegiea gigantea]|uniref:Uncharacterized protein n=1 Tax=Carnegiea gigantea TaxID=171969 RepID=A0A9Q1JV67_9CARY|nr:hypothetical protein Cgig2_007497 [Carnegiea gigantea]